MQKSPHPREEIFVVSLFQILICRGEISAECRMQSAELWMIFARSENLQLFIFSCFYNVKLMRKTDEGGFQPQLCTLHSALCTYLAPTNQNLKRS